MPSGDAGLERQPVDVDVLRQRLHEVGQLMQEYGDTIHVDGDEPLAKAVLRLAKTVPLLLDEIELLRAQLAAQQAVVDAARQRLASADEAWLELGVSTEDTPELVLQIDPNGHWAALRDALAALDKAQAAQSEGE